MLNFNIKAVGNEQSLPQPFFNHALKFHNIGIPIIPCEEKKPLAKWQRYPQEAINKWRESKPNANIGIITGDMSNITVVDCDDEAISEDELQSEFGKTPFITSTPRGGKHLYYQYCKERTITKLQGNNIDIRAKGGLVISPFSYNQQQRAFYEIIKGNVNDLTNLPQIKGDIQKYLLSTSDKQLIERGNRSNALFYELKNKAKSFRSYDSLLSHAKQFCFFNFEENLLDSEIEATSKKIWEYKITGRIYHKNYSPKAEMMEFTNNKDAFFLLSYLRNNHNGLRKDFFISQQAVAKEIKINEKTLRKSINYLLDNNFLIRRKKSNNNIDKTSAYKGFSYVYQFKQR